MVHQELSLGQTTLQANGILGTPLITGNYVSPEHRLPLPAPIGDHYLRQTFVPAVQEGEVVVCNTLVEGLLRYYKQVGLVLNDSQVIEVEPGNTESVPYGYPVTDPLQALVNNVQIRVDDECSPATLISTFTGPEISAQADALGLLTLEREPSSKSNSKALLRESSVAYGFSMLPGAVVRTEEELNAVLDTDWNTENGIWLKFPTGSGGDLVYRIEGKATPEALLNGIHKLREVVAQSFKEANFTMPFEEFWPSNVFVPPDLPFVVEADAKEMGEIIANGSTQIITNKNGAINTIGHFKQLTSPETGEYLGNEPFNDIDEGMSAVVEEQVNRVGEFNMTHNRYYGIQGIDWFLMRGKDGAVNAYVVELNSRPTANTPPVIMAEKLHAPYWINTNVFTDQPIRSVDDFIDLVGPEYAYGSPTEGGMVVPQAFRTIVRRKGIEASPNFKILIMGSGPEHCREIMQLLESKKIKFRPQQDGND